MNLGSFLFFFGETAFDNHMSEHLDMWNMSRDGGEIDTYQLNIACGPFDSALWSLLWLNSSISIEQEYHDRVQDVLSMEIKCYI